MATARDVSPTKTTRYFAYGSNLDIKQMRARCPSATKEGRAFLPGFRLAFGGHSPGWGGAVATLLPRRGARVPGLMYRVAAADLPLLDIYEGTYERVGVEVVTPGGLRRAAMTYVLRIDREAAPSLAYLDVIARAYKAQGFDRDALAALAAGAT